MDALLGLLLAAAAQTPPRQLVFPSDVRLVYVGVVVRDRSGAPVRGLAREDFTVLEDGKAQTIETFQLEEVAAGAAPEPEAVPAPSVPLLSPPTAPAAPPRPDPRARDEELRGRRLVVLLFDGTSMPPEQLERAVEAARRYVDARMTAADLVAVASVGETGLTVEQDFTADRGRLRASLDALAGIETPAAGGAGAEGAAAAAGEDAGAEPTEGEAEAAVEGSELELFDVDRRLRAIETLAAALAPLRQKKSAIYFSNGMTGIRVENQVELRAAIDRAVKANLAIYPVDTRGLEADVPGGDASRPSRFDRDTFSGRAVQRESDQRMASQDALAALAADTGGRSFLDSNEFAPVFDRVLADTASYYVLGYASTNTRRDGRFRRIEVKLRKPALRIEHRRGYYADKDFEHQTRADRRRRLQEQLLTDLSATDLPVWLRTAYFRDEGGRFRVLVSIGVPGASVPFVREKDEDRASLDLLGVVRDEGQRAVARLEDTVRLAVRSEGDVRRKNVQYQAVLAVPPGRYRLKVVLRENRQGTLGSFEADLLVPDLRRAPLKVSSVVLGTQLQPAKAGAASPLARDGTELVPSLTHVVSAAKPVYFYYEVYDPARTQGDGVRLLTSLSFFRGRVRRYETPLLAATRLDAPDRRAAVFQLAVPAGSLKPGLYVCQVNVIDDAAGTFTFPRLAVLVR